MYNNVKCDKIAWGGGGGSWGVSAPHCCAPIHAWSISLVKWISQY